MILFQHSKCIGVPSKTSWVNTFFSVYDLCTHIKERISGANKFMNISVKFVKTPPLPFGILCILFLFGNTGHSSNILDNTNIYVMVEIKVLHYKYEQRQLKRD